MPAKGSEGKTKGLETAKQVRNKYTVNSRLHLIDLATGYERCLTLKALVSHPGCLLHTAAPEQFILILVHVSYVRNPYAAAGVQLPAGLWVESG